MKRTNVYYRTALHIGVVMSLALVPERVVASEPSATLLNTIKLSLTLIPSGEFNMGSHETPEDLTAFFNKFYGVDSLTISPFKNEGPQHHVRITRPFYLGTYHVTRGQFRVFVTETGYKTTAETAPQQGATGWNSSRNSFEFDSQYSWRNTGFDQSDDHPVLNVGWNDAVAFCAWLSRKEGKNYRLPTEAEWEYACRAGTTTRYFCGDDPAKLYKYANVADAAAKAAFPDWKFTIKGDDKCVFTARVGSYSPNAFGLYDMHGNAWQWCADFYDTRYYAISPVDDPTGPKAGINHVVRGGAWDSWVHNARSSVRDRSEPNGRYSFTGFRVARDK